MLSCQHVNLQEMKSESIFLKIIAKSSIHWKEFGVKFDFKLWPFSADFW